MSGLFRQILISELFPSVNTGIVVFKMEDDVDFDARSKSIKKNHVPQTQTNELSCYACAKNIMLITL